MVITALPLLISSTRNHLFLLYGVFNRDKIIFGTAGLNVGILSTMNHHLLHQSTLNRARIMSGFAGLPLTIPFTRNHSCLWHQDHVGYCWPPSLCFIHQESCLSSSWCFAHPGSYWLLLASLCLFHPQGIISFSSRVSSTGPGLFLVLLASMWVFYPP